MNQKSLKLSKKSKLTHDVYELIFVSTEILDCIPGQFITFILSSWLRRAYSVSYSNWRNFEFIIKRLEEWRWWSKELCDLEIWETLPYIWPVGHFVLKNNPKSKLFIGTGTWFAPLYFQLISALENSIWSRLHFVFWIRKTEDIFYEDILKKLKTIYTNFSYDLYLSREDTFVYKKWYVTDFLLPSNIAKFEEFYMCGSPQMIWDSRKKLEDYWVDKDNIFFEQY